MLDDLKNVFDRLGYHSEPVHFEKAIPYSKLRDRLEGPFASTEVSKVLRHLPELFVMNHKMVHGIFFVKILEEQAELAGEARETYAKFYSKDILILRVKKNKNAVRFVCCWIDEQDRPQSLVEALRSRFTFSPHRTAIDALAKDGWLV